MTNLGFPVEFDLPITSTVTAVLIPVDRFTRTEVRSGVTAWVQDLDQGRPLPYRLIRNRRGYFCLTDQLSDADYTFRVDPGTAGYIGPIDVQFNPAADGLSQVVWLDPKPDYGFSAEVTLVRGLVVADSGGPLGPTGLDGAVVSLDGERFQTVTDSRGAFVLALELPETVAGEPVEPVEADLRFDHPDHGPRVLTVTLSEGRPHIFAEPIELDGANEPPFA